ncbi:MAG TPA: alpha/beta hydrolase [Verrucomicrobiae bacterium]|nr:alpha/beta hydrolase [Verrucomicrobiae bacterium]
MKLFLAMLAAILSLGAAAQDSFPLWKEGAPGALGTEPKDIPTLTPFLAPKEKSTGATVVVLPGGGYGGLAQHEGKDYALWLNSLGVHAFVLKYRLGPNGYKHPRMLEDAARAVRTVRARAQEWSLDPKRVGIMGSSAGGHLASTLLTHFDAGNANGSDLIEKESSRPDIGILCYPVITMGHFTHEGSKKNLLGQNPSEQLIEFLSNEKQVTRDTPPTFLFHTVEDTAVPVENSLMFADALRKNGVSFDLHIYEKGRHGIGLANGHPWTKDCEAFLRTHAFIK